ncbi:glycosyltransferase family 4 protein [Pedobacter sp. KR3-3]|uniref:Glycosyltransferase family 4 protein n=1 Tax=Pedobacter albus TaxID=3113905 RepID=A0ABU7IBL0_9SPHI|nr:glycosyltransferase family 4 protein [Pedobacter sp. KR3-3]MEE1946853.1 glycosyltransferase family 4 protein [Pedobacter sp. KR3-3]
MSIKVFRISTVSQSLRVTLRGQFKYLKGMGYEYTLLCSPDNLIEDVAKAEDAKYLPLNLTRRITPFKDLRALIKLIGYLIKEKPQIVHSHSPKAGLIGMLAAFICRTPRRIHTVAGLPLVEKTGIIKRLLIGCEQITYLCSSVVVFNSVAQAEFVISNGWINKRKVRIIGKGSSNGVDLSYFNVNTLKKENVLSLKSEIGIMETDFVLGYVGRVGKPKGINELVRAFERIEKDYKNVKLLLVGEEEPNDPLDEDVYETIESNKNIIRIDHQKDIRPYILISDVFLLPSYREGFPQIIMQACAMNSCIICTDINGCNEMIEDNHNGLLIAPKSIDAIESAVKKLINNADLRDKFKMNSRKYIEENFDQELFWKRLEALYRSIEN